MTRRHRLFRFTVPILAALAPILCIEGAASLYWRFLGPPRTHEEFRRRVPAPYRDADYFSPEFIAESFRQPGGWIYPEGTRLILPKNFNGRFFHVQDGLRFTTDQPDSPQNRIYLFGGSTIYCSEVPDALTVPSQLQRLFNLRFPGRIRVENYGTTSVTISQQLERLRQLHLAEGDVVVFYDGVNDVLQTVWYGNPDETMAERDRRVIGEMRWPDRFAAWLSRRSRFFQLFYNPAAIPPQHLANPSALALLLNALTTQYTTAIREADAFSRAAGASFIHFLQPHLYSDAHLSAYELELQSNRYIVHAGVKEAYAAGYPALQAALDSLPGEIRRIDLSTSLDQRPAGMEHFLDFCHVTHNANSVIAKAIFDAVSEVILRQSPQQDPAH